MPRILAIDFGERRIGLALSDPLGITAQGLPTIDTRKVKDVFGFIGNLVTEKGVDKLVVGMPKNMNGSIGPKGQKVERFMQKLARKTEVDVVAWDEELCSWQPFGGPAILDDDLRTMTDGIECSRMVILTTCCFGGGQIHDLAQDGNRIITPLD